MARPKPTQNKLVTIAAECRIVGVAVTAKRWGLHRTTVQKYLNQVNNDQLLEKSCSDLVQDLLSNSQQEISELLSSAAIALKARISIAESSEDAAIIRAIGESIKTFAELDVAYKALLDEPIETIDVEVKNGDAIVQTSSSDE